jgi:hypothetical protein
VNARVRRDVLNAVVTVQVLVERDLEDRRAALAGGDDGGSEEVEPDLRVRRCEHRGMWGKERKGEGTARRRRRRTYAVELLTVRGDGLVLVLDPVLVPAVEGSRV